jgi:hypothetical protein
MPIPETGYRLSPTPRLAGFVEEIQTLANVPRPDSILRIGNVVVPSCYGNLEEPLEAFFGDEERTCRVLDKNAFIMTRFKSGNQTLESID